MRIIAGKAKGYLIRVPQGEVRPTQDRVREALFNILGTLIQGARVLDLYCGSGSVGLEALSRGAASARMVDASRASCAMAKQNLEKSKLIGGSVVQSDCLQFVKRDSGKYDIIFADPPYAKAIGDRDMIAELMTDRLHELLADDGYFIAEAQLGYGVGDIHTREFAGWQLIDERTYGKNTILFYRKQP
ncbi:MAG: 16S rRNA (guanine(966)-N(2))-methyltransferase RsmD [Akkermansia sp.]|nr:16S rRNA (guanine(966)-N(2))-methyltransferase RsmD [Akkermansia sp.]MBQ3526726.1 16S rRNA (guanine(966)-N(2))-methyltransferase RsmD [Akkermansia sp.]